MADNPKVAKDMKKITDKSDKILSDSDDSHDLECDTCGVRLENARAYESHMQGKKHQKKVTEAKLMAKAARKGPENDDEDDDDDEEEDGNTMHCETCDKYFSGYIPYAAHVKGSLHAKNSKAHKLRQQLGDMPGVLAKESEDDDSDDDDITQKPYARCTVCEKEFSGPQNYKLHLKSAVHKKKVKQSQMLQTLKADQEGEDHKSGDEEIFSKCDVCQKSFSGIVPYQVHMKSNAHKKSLEKKKIAEEIKEFCTEGDSEAPGFVCKECKKVFPDPLGFKTHLANNSHEKQKAKDALLEFLKTHSEIVFVSPFDQEHDSEKGSDSDEADSEYYLICKLCQFSFSGPESAQDHVKSKKHLHLKKEKKMQKLLKEKMKNASVKSEDKKSQNKKDKSVKEASSNGKPENSLEGEDFELI